MLDQFQTHLVARRRSPATIKLRMIYLRHLASRHELATATLSDLEAILVSHPEWKPETINAAIGSWSVFYKWANRNHLLDHDPTEYLERAHVIKEVKKLADDDAILDAIAHATPAERAMLLLGREGGLRRSEIATLRTIHRNVDWLSVTGKGGRTRRIHLTPTLASALDDINADDYYFPGRYGGHITADAVYRAVRRLIGTAPHSLRRSALTAVYRGSGGDIRMAQEFAGHANPNTTAVYIQVNEGDLIRAGSYAALAA